jgi:2-methylcitrate dehydratase PrpD
LGNNWLILDQYFKPYPVCRWAHSPIEAVLELRRKHRLTSHDVAELDVYTFHEATRLATNTPKTTEEAQYSTSFPTAVALVRGTVGPGDVDETALTDPEILRLSKSMLMHEDDHANAAFPDTRLARVTLTLKSGETLKVIGKSRNGMPPCRRQNLKSEKNSMPSPIQLLGTKQAVELKTR